MPNLRDYLGRNSNRARLKELHRVSPPPLGYLVADGFGQVQEELRRLPLETERRLIEGEPGDGQATIDCDNGQNGTRGVSEDGRASTHDVDQSAKILDLSLDVVRKRVTAFTSTAAIVVDNREMVGQVVGQRFACGSIVERAKNEDDRLPVPDWSKRIFVPSAECALAMSVLCLVLGACEVVDVCGETVEGGQESRLRFWC